MNNSRIVFLKYAMSLPILILSIVFAVAGLAMAIGTPISQKNFYFSIWVGLGMGVINSLIICIMAFSLKNTMSRLYIIMFYGTILAILGGGMFYIWCYAVAGA